MKYALISEEQIKQVQETINKSIEMSDGWTTVSQQNVLALMRLLKPSDPFAAWRSTGNDECDGFVHFPLPNQKLSPQDTPLFALEQSK